MAMQSVKLNWSVIGHNRIKRFLENAYNNGRLSHAYLFYGPVSVGKTSLAMDFARALFCGNDSEKPCGKCPSCLHSLNSHPDISIIDQEGTISIKQIRGLVEQFSRKSFWGGPRVAIIANAENMQAEASNALLKFLEEPYGQAHIILTVSQIGFLPKTILSRAQKINFFPLSENDISDFPLLNTIPSKKRYELKQLAFNRPGYLKKIIDDPAYLAEISQIRKDLEKLLKQPIYEKFLSSASLASEETPKLTQLLDYWLFYLAEKVSADQEIVFLTKVRQTIEKVLETKQYLRMNLNKKLVFDNLFLEI